MRSGLSGKYWRGGLTLLFAAGIFAFWKFGYPQALSYQEQNQLFLFSGDYFWKDVRVAGGLSAWLSEFLVQFYYVEWLGALILALLFACLQRLTWVYIKRLTTRWRALWFIVSFIPALLLLGVMGDHNVLLAFPVAVVLAVAIAVLMRRASLWWDLLIIPICFWLVGSTMWIYVALRLFDKGLRHCYLRLWLAPYLLGVQLLAAYTVLSLWSPVTVIRGNGYYRIPYPYTDYTFGFNKDVYELLRQDYLVRNERWDEIIRRAEKYQPKTPFSSVCVNLALAKKHQLAERMFDFYQSGRDALVMPIFRDNMSDMPTSEVFWHLGMINSCLRYSFDLQEAILNAKRSSRLTKRLTQCYIINGKYEVAQKHLALLKKTLFYRRWALETERIMQSEAAINAHPVYGRKRQLRFKTEMLYNYNEIDKMFGLLFVNDPSNTLALDYFMAQMLLRGDVDGFINHLPWAQQYGGYQQMPRGYRDALQCIQAGGNLPGSSYAKYIKFMSETGRVRKPE
ncbi:MAG: DUF6057 family protein [Prevotella sp.]|nr:DUF6057 family protein [Prevotella sp.]